MADETPEPPRPLPTPDLTPSLGRPDRPEQAVLRPPRSGMPVALAARSVVALELAAWPHGDGRELDLAVERLAVQGRHFELRVEQLIVALHELIERHARGTRPEWEIRPLRERLVSVLIQAYHRGQP